MWIAVAEREPLTAEDSRRGEYSSLQVKVVFTYEGSAYLGIGLFTRWTDGTVEWAELDEDKNHFTEMKHGVPTHYIILPEIP